MVILALVRFPLGFGLFLMGGRVLVGVILWMVFDETVDTFELEGVSAVADDNEIRNIRPNNKNVNLVFFHAGIDLLLISRGFD